MSFIQVTKKSNIEGLSESNEILLKSEEEIGYLGKTHASVVTVSDENGNPTLGFLARVEVFWDNKRTPAPALEDPNDLVWLTLPTEEEEEGYEDEEVDNENRDEEKIHDLSFL